MKSHVPVQHRRRLVSPANAIIVLHGLSSFCFGLIFPYTAIYLSDQPGVGTGGVALYYAVSGSANLLVALLLAAGWVRPPMVALGVLGNSLWFAGNLMMPIAVSYPVVAMAGAATGAGQGCFLAAVVPILNALVPAERRRQVFARRYAVLNATLAAGSLVAGTATVLLPRSVIPYFFVINAIGIVPTALALLASRDTLALAKAMEPAAEDVESGGGDKMPSGMLIRVTLPVIVFQLAAYLFGFSQFEATSPLVVEKLMEMPLFTVSLLLAINVAVIVLAQGLVTRLLKGRPEAFGLTVVAVLWAGGYLVAGMLSSSSYEYRLAGLLIFAVMFALGECAYSCSFHPWLISVVPESELTRASALANSMMGIGTFVGPSLGVGLALSGNASVVWLGLAISCAGLAFAVGLAGRPRRRLPEQMPAAEQVEPVTTVGSYW